MAGKEASALERLKGFAAREASYKRSVQHHNHKMVQLQYCATRYSLQNYFLLCGIRPAVSASLACIDDDLDEVHCSASREACPGREK